MFPELNSIKKRRERLGLKQYAFAKKINLSQSMLAKVENGRAEPSYETARKIFEELETLEHANEKMVKDVMNKHVITLDVNDTVEKAVKIAKQKSISQFPVLEGDKIIGCVRTIDLIDTPKQAKIGSLENIQLPTVSETTPLNTIKPLFKQNQAIIITKQGKITGIITPEDII
jgi:predicted transcriptional regulator